MPDCLIRITGVFTSLLASFLALFICKLSVWFMLLINFKHISKLFFIVTRTETRRHMVLDVYKKLSYRRETARQLPTWRGLSPPVHCPPPLATPMHTVESETRNKRTSSVPSVKRTLS